MVFLLAMVLYPDTQKRAQAEIDSVIGGGSVTNVRGQGVTTLC